MDLFALIPYPKPIKKSDVLEGPGQWLGGDALHCRGRNSSVGVT